MGLQNTIMQTPANATTRLVSEFVKKLQKRYDFAYKDEKAPLWAYHQDEGIWKNDGEKIVRKFISKKLTQKQRYRSRVANEVISALKGLSPDLGEAPKEIMVVENGRIDLETGKFHREFKKEEWHKIKTPVKYNQDANCPHILSFLKNVLGKKEDLAAILEMFGYCLVKDAPYDIILILLGDGSNGKSVLLTLFEEFLGTGNISHCDLQEIAESRFAKAELQNKLANIAGEIPSKPLKETALIKDLTGGNVIKGERKFQNPFSFNPFAKLIFSANKLPYVFDTSFAFWRRMRVIEFPRTFTPEDEDYVPRNELVEKITSEEELSGLLNYAIRFYQKLREDNRFVGSKTAEETELDYMRKADPLRFLCQKYISMNVNNKMYADKRKLYDNLYLKFCNAEDVPAVSYRKFHSKFKQTLRFADDKRRTLQSGEVKRVYLYLDVNFQNLKKEIGVRVKPSDIYVK